MNSEMIQSNLEDNIKKVFDKLREEGFRGLDIDSVTYPIEENINKEIKNEGMTFTYYYKDKQIKNYNDYRKLLLTLESLIQMYNRNLCNTSDFFEHTIVKIEEEIEYIQNASSCSLDKNYIPQYSCLIKCYDSLLTLVKYFR